MAGQRKKSSKSSSRCKHAASSSQWSLIPSPEFITMTLKSKLSSRCQRLRPTNSRQLPSSQRSTVKKSQSMPCWKIRKLSCDTQQLVGFFSLIFPLMHPKMINSPLINEKFINKTSPSKFATLFPMSLPPSRNVTRKRYKRTRTTQKQTKTFR